MALIDTFPLPGQTLTATLEEDYDCDDLPGARGSISSPLVVYNIEAQFEITLKELRSVHTSIRACVFNNDDKAQVFQSEGQFRVDEPSGMLSLALVPNVVNYVKFVGLDANGIISAPAEWWLYPRAGFGLLPLGYQFLLTLNVTDAELDELLAKLIIEASKVSKALAEFLTDHVEYSDDQENHTTLIDRAGGKTKENTQILINKAAIKAALAAIKAAEVADRPQMEEDLLRQLLEALLHEAGHRMAIVNGTYAEGAAEEDRDTQSLIRRLIDLLKKLKTNLPTAPVAGKQALGDGEGLKDEDIAKWMERLKAVVKGEKGYRFRKVARAIQPWKDKHRHVKSKWDEFTNKLNDIKNDDSRDQQQKQQAAQSALDAFNSDVSADKTALEQEFDVNMNFGFNPTTFEPTNVVSPTDTYKGEAIP